MESKTAVCGVRGELLAAMIEEDSNVRCQG
jgi:hypothetical protein